MAKNVVEKAMAIYHKYTLFFIRIKSIRISKLLKFKNNLRILPGSTFIKTKIFC